MTPKDPHSRAADAVHGGRRVEAQYVRQGRGGRRILWVLGGGLALVILGFALVWGGGGPGLDEATNERPAVEAEAAAAFQGPDDRIDVPAADAPTTPEGEPTAPPTGEAPNVNAPTVNTGAPPAP